ncbi:hypothetical protein AB4Z52_33385 [Rhizobium sp. 2YAF20]|uniref:hypothetical protein n=1 Tax=Rhizobium sp. 2YAF20 TaxID=3233027 RepID=UPI003F9EB2C3
MNKFFIASAIALASLAATSLPSHAASVEVMTDGGNNDGNYDGQNYHRRHHYDEHAQWDQKRHHRDCFTKTVKEWHHGHKVITEERICR